MNARAETTKRPTAEAADRSKTTTRALTRRPLPPNPKEGSRT